MVGVPVAALAFAAVLQVTFTLSPAEAADRLMGATQAAVTWPYDGPVDQHPTDTGFVSTLGVASGQTPLPPPSLERLLALLPPGSRILTDRTTQLPMATATGVGNLAARMLDYADPLARGIYRPLSGHAPAGPDEVAVTPAAARRLGATVGGTIHTTDGSRTFRIVGTVEDPGNLNATTILLRPGALPEAATNARVEVQYLVATPGPMTWAEVRQLNTHGIVAVSRYVLSHPPVPSEVPFRGYEQGDSETALAVGIVSGVAVLEVVLLAGPAFAVGARRRRRDLALVAASGGTPGHLRRIVLSDGVVLGGLAAALGVGLGVLAAIAARPYFEGLSGIRSGALRLPVTALLALAGVSVVTGVLAALVPAWIASRQEVVAALAGRRGVTRSRRRWLLVGVGLVAAGAALAGLGARQIQWPIIVAGLIVAEFGVVLCTPSIVGLAARVGPMLPLAPRIALRDTARNRTSAAPAISAVMAAVVGSLAVGVILVSSDRRAVDDYRSLGRVGDVSVFGITGGPKGAPGDAVTFSPETIDVLRSTLPVNQVVQVDQPDCDPGPCFVVARVAQRYECPYGNADSQRPPTAAEQRAARRDPRCETANRRNSYFGGFGTNFALTVIVDEDDAGVLANLPSTDVPAVAMALRGGAVVVSDPTYLDNGRASLTVISPSPDGSANRRTISGPGVALPHPAAVPITMMTAATARALGFGVSPLILLATTTRMPTVAERDRAQAALGDRLPLYVEEGPQRNTAGLLVLTIIAGVIALAATAIATGLAATDGRADLATLGAVGASPWVRRVLSVCQSAVIAGLGSVLGALVGLGSAVAVLLALNQRYADVWPAPTSYPIVVPWRSVLVAVVVVPLVAMLGAGLFTRSRLPIERRL